MTVLHMINIGTCIKKLLGLEMRVYYPSQVQCTVNDRFFNFFKSKLAKLPVILCMGQ